MQFFKKKLKISVETGADFSKPFLDDVEHPAFFEENVGPGKLFPGGITCVFRGKKVLCFIRSSEKGDANYTILADTLREFDARDMVPRTEGAAPFLLLDDHGSRTEMEFLEFVNDDSHKWVVCIGVPCGASVEGRRQF